MPVVEFVSNIDEAYENGNEQQRIKIDDVLKQYIGRKWSGFLEKQRKL